MLFETDKTNNIYTKGFVLYKIYKDILFEADSIIISGNHYNYENYEKRILLNYAVGFIKMEVQKTKK